MPGIRIRVSADDAVREGRKAEQSLRGVGDQARQTESRLSRFQRALGESRHFNQFTSGLRNTTRMLTSFQSAVFGAAGTAGMGYFIDRSVQAADQIGKTAAKIGVGVEALQELRYAAELAGVSQQNLDMGLQRFSRRVAEAAQGEGELKKTIEQYGISLRDSNGQLRSSVDLLGDFADVIQNAESEQEQLRIAFKAFDSEGAAMVNLLREGSGAMNQLRQDARELGIVMDKEMVKNAENANDQLTRLKRVVGVQMTQAVVTLAPEIGKLAGEMTSWVQENEKFLTQDVPGHVGDIADSLGRVKEIYDSAPAGLISGTGAGIVGTYLFGPKAGAVIGMLTMMNAQIDELNQGLDDMGSSVEGFRKLWSLSPNLFIQEFSRLGSQLVAEWASSGKESGEEFSNEFRGAVRLDEVVVSGRDLSGVMDQVFGSVDDMIPTVDELVQSWGNLTQESKKHKKEVEDLSGTYDKMYNLGAFISEQRGKELHEASARHSVEEWKGANDEVERDTRETHDRTRTWLEREYEQFSDNLSRSLVDEIVDGTGDIEDVFKTTLKNIIAYYAKNAIIVPVIANMNLPGLSNQAAMQMQGGGQGGGMGLPGGGAMDWVGNNVPGMGFLGSTLPGTGSTVGTLGGAAGAPTGTPVGGLSAGGALGYGALGGLGYSALGGMMGLPQSKYSGITAGIGGAAGAWGGSAIGALGSLGGPVGTAIGSIAGGMLGSAFKEKVDDTDFEAFFGEGLPYMDKYGGPEGAITRSGGTDKVNFAEWEGAFGTRTYDFGRDTGDAAAGTRLGKEVHQYVVDRIQSIEDAFDIDMDKILREENLLVKVGDPESAEELINTINTEFAKTYGDSIRKAVQKSYEDGGIPIDFAKGASIDQMMQQYSQAQEILSGIDQTVRHDSMTEQEVAVERVNEKYDQMKQQLQNLGVAVEDTNLSQARAIELEEAKAQAVEESNREQELTQQVTDARKDYISALEREYRSLQEEQERLEQNLSDAKSTYISMLEDEQTELESTADAMDKLTKSLSDYHSEILLGSESTLGVGQQARFARSEFTDTAELARRGDQEAMKALQGVSSDYLSAARDAGMGGDAFREVQKALNATESVAESELSTAELQLENVKQQLREVKDLEDSVSSIKDAQSEYQDAQRNLSEWQSEHDLTWYKEEITRLEKIDSSVLSLKDAQKNYIDSLAEGLSAGFDKFEKEYEKAKESRDSGPVDSGGGSDDRDSGGGKRFKEVTYLKDVAEEWRRKSGDSDWTWRDSLRWIEEEGSGSVREHYEKHGHKYDYEFAAGGTISGPKSGYSLPGVEFHGVEHITPDSQMKDVKEQLQEIKKVLSMMLNTSGDQKKYARKMWQILDGSARGDQPLQTEST